MVSTRKKRHSNRRLRSHLDEFDQDATFANAVNGSQQRFAVNDGTIYQELTSFRNNSSNAIM